MDKYKIAPRSYFGDWGDTAGGWIWFSSETGKPTMSIVSSYASYAEMEPPEVGIFEFISGEIGEEAAGKMFADFTSGYSGSEYTIWEHQPELSAAPDED